MAGVRDPAFWKRFSMAVHLDEEQQRNQTDVKQSDSWLSRQNAKRKQRTRICWCFWIGFIIFVAALVAVIIWLLSSDVLKGGSGGDSNGNTAGEDGG